MLECIKIYANTFINEIDTKHLCIIIDKDKYIYLTVLLNKILKITKQVYNTAIIAHKDNSNYVHCKLILCGNVHFK